MTPNLKVLNECSNKVHYAVAYPIARQLDASVHYSVIRIVHNNLRRIIGSEISYPLVIAIIS